MRRNRLIEISHWACSWRAVLYCTDMSSGGRGLGWGKYKTWWIIISVVTTTHKPNPACFEMELRHTHKSFASNKALFIHAFFIFVFFFLSFFFCVCLWHGFAWQLSSLRVSVPHSLCLILRFPLVLMFFSKKQKGDENNAHTRAIAPTKGNEQLKVPRHRIINIAALGICGEM